MSEKCQRCGVKGYDRRTLWMSCLYDMDELGLPFTGIVTETGPKIFYTLRVCKGCRAEWMQAIKSWFESSRDPKLDENGNYEMSKEEYAQCGESIRIMKEHLSDLL